MSQPSAGRKRTPTSEEFVAWRSYIESAEALRRALGEGLQEQSGISRADYAVLLALDEAPEHRVRSSVLAEAMGWERSRLSHHLRRMEHRNLICRNNVTGDNRASEVELTADGGHLFRSASAAHLRLVRELFVDALGPAHVAAAGEIGDRIGAHLVDRSGPEDGAS